MEKTIAHAFTLLLFINAACAPALAQCADSGSRGAVQPNQSAQRLPTLPDIGRPYSIRVTTGVSTNAGFERCLTDRDPNLRRWTWIPVTSYTQTTIGNGRAALPQRPQHVYAKPTHVPLPIVDHGGKVVMVPTGHYVKPTRVAPPIVDHGEWAVARQGGRAGGEVSGRLIAHQPTNARGAQAAAKTYGVGYGDTYGRLCSSSGNADRQEQLRVNARLVAAH